MLKIEDVARGFQHLHRGFQHLYVNALKHNV